MKPLKRVPTLVPGLDAMLGGGLVEAGVYFVQGAPGTGKTTLANQMCFGHIAQGGQALYMTLLAESHVRMMQHMLGQSFFDASLVGKRIHYLSGYQALEAGGLKGIVALLRSELTRERPGLLVLDGLLLGPPGGDEDRRLKEFVHELQSLAALTGTLVLMLTSGQGRSTAAEQTMVDGIFMLEDRGYGLRRERLLRISKFRGVRVARGEHSYCITDDGLCLFPRLESEEAPPPKGVPAPAPTGLPGLDALFGAGAPRAATVTVVQGPSGTGKTLVGLRFLAQCSADEPGLLLGFNEPPERLVALGQGVGTDLAPLLESGALAMHWRGPGDETLDQLGHQLLGAVERRGVRRLVIDALSGFADKAMFAERGYRFLWALLDGLRRRRVSTLLVCDADALAALGVGHVAAGLGALAEQVVELSAMERRVLRIAKARGQRFDPGPHGLHIGDDGLRLTGAQPA